MAAPLDRRQFLGRGLVAGAGLVVVGGGASSLLAACSSDSKTTTSTGTTAAGAARARWLRARWAPSTSSSPGSRTSSSPAPTSPTPTGYYIDAGLLQGEPHLGRPERDPGRRRRLGQGAFVGISAPDITASGIVNNGDKLIAVGALFQKNPFCIDVAGQQPARDTRRTMVGKKIGVQSVNEPVWNAFLKANELDPSSITQGAGPVRPDPAGQRRGRRLVLVRHQRAQPAQGAGRRHRQLPAQRLQVPAGLADLHRADRHPHQGAGQAQGVPDGRHQGLARQPQGSRPRRQPGRHQVRQGPRPHRGGAGARVGGAEQADPRRPTRRPRASSRSARTRSTRASPRWPCRASTSRPTSSSTCRCWPRSTRRTRI